jgi:hypothetical protein
MANLIVVVDPDYAERLETVALLAPVWVVDTRSNRNIFERLWKSRPHIDHRERGAITCYAASDPKDRVGSFLGIIGTLKEHHGEVSGNFIDFPSGFVLEVIGLALDDGVTCELREIGFTTFVDTPEGFQASK